MMMGDRKVVEKLKINYRYPKLLIQSLYNIHNGPNNFFPFIIIYRYRAFNTMILVFIFVLIAF